MSQSVLVTIPDKLVEDFINHLGRMKPEKAKHITIRLLSDNDISALHEVIDFPVRIPDDEWDDNLLPLEDLLDHTGGYLFDSDRYK